MEIIMDMPPRIMQNITMPKVLFLRFFKLWLVGIMSAGFFASSAALFYAVHDLPFMLNFPNTPSFKDIQSPQLTNQFDYYIRKSYVSPFLILQDRQLNLSIYGLKQAKTEEEPKQYKDTLFEISQFYQDAFLQSPENGYIAFLLAETFLNLKQYERSARYLMKSYDLYPISARLAYPRHILSFQLYKYLPEKYQKSRDQDYKVIQILNNDFKDL